MSKIDLYKFIHMKPLTALVSFPPGLGRQALTEIESILNDPMIPEKKNTSSPKLLLFPEKILIRNTSLQSIMGICFRSFFLRDIYILLNGLELKNIEDELPDTFRTWIKETKSFSLQLQVRKNPSLDTEAFIEECKSFIHKAIGGAENIEPANNRIGPRFLVSILRNRSELYFAVKSKPLYQRGFRSPFPLSAPISEDLASILINFTLQKFSFNRNSIQLDAFIPFSGTGTFAFELFMQIYKILPGLLKFQEDDFSKHLNYGKIWKFLRDKSCKGIYRNLADHSPCLKIHNFDFRSDIVENSLLNESNLQSILDQNLGSIITQSFPGLNEIMEWKTADFFETLIPNLMSKNLFLPLNPPYGIRHKNKESVASFFQRIARKTNQLCLDLPPETKIHGFLLCPDANSYSAASEIWRTDWNLETLHFSQGKLSIRALFFSSKN
ncbi:MAG: hypothetical protein CK427_07110 [Leptospira sp.]|nr:MAG: hypothetical protein CK427_07110 [Leptospira sp.]